MVLASCQEPCGPEEAITIFISKVPFREEKKKGARKSRIRSSNTGGSLREPAADGGSRSMCLLKENLRITFVRETGATCVIRVCGHSLLAETEQEFIEHILHGINQQASGVVGNSRQPEITHSLDSSDDMILTA